jgi:nucleoside-triphosphatase THEP1
MAAFKRANHIIEKSLENHATGYLIIDELGKLELQDQGLHKWVSMAIERTMQNDFFHLILVVRTSLLTEITKKYNIHAYEGIDKTQLSEKLIQTV